MIISLILIFLIVCLLVFIVANKLIKKTNWWKNQFVFTHQFDHSRRYDVVNVGSNPARFAFFYDSVAGQNWSTGTQGLDMDLLLLKEYEGCLKKEATVLLPIVPFSSVSGYLGIPHRPQYISKFVKIVHSSRFVKENNVQEAHKFIKYPLLHGIKTMQFLIKDASFDDRLSISEQSLQFDEMEENAEWWSDLWKKEFNIDNLNDTLPDHLKEGREKSVKMMVDMVNFLKERGYKPVIVSPPMSASLMKHFTKEVRDTYIYSFVNEVKKKVDVPYMDYMDSEFQNNEYYFNALFMNLRGRKLFTHKVLKDLGLV